MKILVLQDDFRPYEKGGAGLIAGYIADGMVSAGHQVTVITTVQDINLVGRSVIDGITIHRLYSQYNERYRSYRSLYNWSVIRDVEMIVRDLKPDAVHAHNIHYHISYHSLYIVSKYTRNIFLTAHDIMSFYQGSFTEFINRADLSCPTNFNYKVTSSMLFKAFKKRYNPFHNYLVRWYLSKVKRIIAVSHSLQDALNQNGIKNTVVIYNGLDLDSYVQDPKKIEEYKKENGFIGHDIIIFGGRLSGVKGGELILQAMSNISNTLSKAKLIVYGKKDAYTNRMIARAKELSIDDKISFVGWNGEEELKKLYASSDVAVVPSVCFDSFPTTNLIAFASHKPAVSTCFGGSREIVENNVNGYIVNPFDVKSLSQKILYLLQNKEEAIRFGNNGYNLMKEKFTQKIMIEKYLSIFLN
jgi:glycosyltransferase involved in cell wall biosynthesis